MIKINRITTILLPAFLLASLFTFFSYADTDSDAKYKRAMSSYSNFLEKMESGYNSDGEWAFNVEGFSLFDFNYDGIPELITHGGGRMDYFKIYTSDAGHVRNIHWGSSLNIYSNGIVAVGFGGGGYWTNSYYKMNEEFELEYVYAYTEWLNDNPETFSEGERSYEEDSERVDYNVIQKRRDEILSGASLLQLNYYDNTDANRANSFGFTETPTEYRENLSALDEGYNYINIKDRDEYGAFIEISFYRLTGTDGYIFAEFIDSDVAVFYDWSSNLSGTLTFDEDKILLDLDEVEGFYSSSDLSEFVKGLHHEFIANNSVITDIQMLLLNHISYKEDLVVESDISYRTDLVDKKYQKLFGAIANTRKELKGFELIDFDRGDITGFRAASFKKGNSILLVYCGTEDGADMLSDVGAGTIDWSLQDNQAKQFAIDNLNNNPDCSIYVTGYSLGGRLAYLGAEAISKSGNQNTDLLRVVTFNGLGVKSPQKCFEKISEEKVTNYIVKGDDVSDGWVKKFNMTHFGDDIKYECTNPYNLGSNVIDLNKHDLYTFFQALTGSTLSLSMESIGISDKTYVYNGKTQSPLVVIKDNNGEELNQEYAYSLIYPKESKKVGTYTIIIKGKGVYKGTIKVQFSIVPKTTALNKLTATSKGFIAKWKKQTAQTTGYQIQYSTNKNFKSSKKTLTVAKNKTISKKVANLRTKKKYYVRIRTYKTVKGKKYYSAWSKARTVTPKK